MNKKHIKIAFIILFVLFVIFVIIRKINIDNATSQNNQSNVKAIKPKEEKVLKADPRIKMKLEDTTSSTNPKIKENKTQQESPIKDEKKETKKLVKKFKNTEEKIITKSKELIVKKDVLVDEKEKPKKIEKKADIKPLKEASKKIQMAQINQLEPININSIAELKNIKQDIKINQNSESFTYKNSIFKNGDKLGIFTIIKIEPKKIRFMKNEYFYYNLRFFI